MAARAPPPPSSRRVERAPTGRLGGPVEDESMLTTYMVVPPDGGWGWVVMVAAFFSNVVCDGVIYSFGVLYLREIGNEFQEIDAAVALIGSLIQASSQFVGPVVSALVNRYAFQTVMLIGCMTSAIGFGISYFANSVPLMYFTFGVMGGCGFGIMFVVSTIVVSFYFQRWRSIATCISLCGSTVGGIIVGPALQIVIVNYGWRYAALVQSAVLVLCSLLGLTYRPLKPVLITKQLGTNEDMSSVYRQSQLSVISSGAVGPSGKGSHRLGPKNREFPTAAHLVLSETTLALLDTQRTTSGTTRGASRESLLDNHPAWGESRASLASVHIVVGPRNQVDMHHYMTGERRRWFHCNCCWGVRWCGRKKEHDLGARPLYRDDIFYGESVTRLPQYNQVGHIGYNLAVSRVATKKDVEQERSRRCMVCPEAVKRTLATMLDVSLFRSPSFMLYSAVNCLMQFALLVPFVYLSDRAKLKGMSAEDITYLVPMLSLSGLFARLGLAVVTSFPRVPLVTVSIVVMVIGGVGVAFMGVTTSLWAQLVCCSLFGITLATFYSFRSLLIVQLLGLERLTNAFGLLLLFSGCFSVMGAPLSGVLKDVSNSYDAIFYLAGAIIATSGLLMVPLEAVNRREKARRRN